MDALSRWGVCGSWIVASMVLLGCGAGPDSSAGGTGTGAAAGAGGASGGGGQATGGAGGTGGTSLCTPGEHKECPYSGDPATLGVGTCKSGEQTCNPDGLSYGPCASEVTPTLESCGGADADCDGSPPPLCAGQVLWSERFGGLKWDVGSGVAASATGDVVWMGDTEGAVDFGGGPVGGPGHTFAVARFDGAGQHLWSKGFPGAVAFMDPCLSLGPSDEVYLAGLAIGPLNFGGGPVMTQGSINVTAAKLNASGEHVWSRAFGGSLQIAQVVDSATDPAGNVVLTGYFKGTVDFGGGPFVSEGQWWDAFVVKLDSSGQHVWSKHFGGPDQDMGNSVAVDSAGDVLWVGDVHGSVDFGGGAVQADGMSVVKLDPSGQLVWSKSSFGGNAWGWSLAVGAGDEVFVTGNHSSGINLGGGVLPDSTHLFVAGFDADGQHLWSEGFDGDGSPAPGSGLTVDPAGDLALTGSFQSFVDFGAGPIFSAVDGQFSVFVAKLDPAGQHLWSASFGGTGDDKGHAIAATSAGSLLVTGELRGTLDLGGASLISAGEHDIYLAELSP